MLPRFCLLLLVLLPLSGCGTGRGPTAGDSDAAGTGVTGFLEGVFSAGGTSRPYRLYVPAAEHARPLPLIVMLHGCTQDAPDFARGTRMNELAEERGFLVLYPEQTAQAHPQRCWNWFFREHQQRGAGEPALLAGMTREIVREYHADPSRIYVAGISAGGAMALNLAATYPDLFAAVASHSGVAYGAASSIPEAIAVMRNGPALERLGTEGVLQAMGERTRPVPVILFQGAADPVVNLLNLDAIREQWEGVIRTAGGAVPEVEAEQRPGTSSYRVSHLIQRDAAGTPVLESWLIGGLEHAWSGGSEAGTYTDPCGPDATREIVRFLLQHENTQ